MTAEIQAYTPTDEPAPTTGSLAEWVQDFGGVAHVATTLAATSFIPDSLRVYRTDDTYNPSATAAHVTAAILTGHELGLDPMASLRSIDIIKGTPALRAVALRGILQAAGHQIWVEEATTNRATVCGRRRGSEQVQRITWTMDDARARGLAQRPVWRAAPRNMLIARATADIARLVAADALLGIPYTVEELQDDDLGAEPEPPPPTPRKARRAPIQAAVITRPAVMDEPSADATPPRRRLAPVVEEPETPPAATGHVDQDPADEPAEPEILATPKQVTAVRRALVTLGLGTSRRQLAAVAQVTGRPIDRLADMWGAEAVQVIAAAADRQRAQEDAKPHQPDTTADEAEWTLILADQDEPSGWDGRRGPEPDAPEWTTDE